jgi:hypothetical protein
MDLSLAIAMHRYASRIPTRSNGETGRTQNCSPQLIHAKWISASTNMHLFCMMCRSRNAWQWLGKFARAPSSHEQQSAYLQNRSDLSVDQQTHSQILYLLSLGPRSVSLLHFCTRCFHTPWMHLSLMGKAGPPLYIISDSSMNIYKHTRSHYAFSSTQQVHSQQRSKIRHGQDKHRQAKHHKQTPHNITPHIHL